MYKITATYDESFVPVFIAQYSDALTAFDEFAKCKDWGNAKEFATYNLSLPDGKMYTKWFNRNGTTGGK